VLFNSNIGVYEIKEDVEIGYSTNENVWYCEWDKCHKSFVDCMATVVTIKLYDVKL
jgi:hypothetical protein